MKRYRWQAQQHKKARKTSGRLYNTFLCGKLTSRNKTLATIFISCFTLVCVSVLLFFFSEGSIFLLGQRGGAVVGTVAYSEKVVGSVPTHPTFTPDARANPAPLRTPSGHS